MIAARWDGVGFSAIARIRNAAMEMEARGEPLIRLEGGEPFGATPAPIAEALGRAALEGKTRYAPTAGIPELRQRLLQKVIVKNAFRAATLDSILVTNGAAQGIFAALSVLVDPGTEVLLLSPYWTPYADMVRVHGGVPVEVPVLGLEGPQPLAEAVARAITPKTRVLLFNSPVNPTGRLFTPLEVEAIAELAEDKELTVIADEAYEELVYDHSAHVSMASLPDMFERTITAFTFSKTFAMTGLRVGYLVAPPAALPALRSAILYGSNGVATPNQWAAVAAFDTPASIREEWRRGYVKRRDRLCEGLRSAGFEVAPTKAALYLFARLPVALGTDSAAAAERLLKEARLSCVPGSAFGAAGEGHVRMSFSVPEETIERAVDALKQL